MKRFFYTSLVLAIGCGLFWWGQKSRNTSAVMVPESENNEDSTNSNKAAVNNLDHLNQNSKSAVTQKIPDEANQGRSLANSLSKESMAPRYVDGDVREKPSTIYSRPGNEDLRSTDLFGNERWKVWRHVQAVPTTSLNSTNENVLATMGGYSVVSSESDFDESADFTSGSAMVVYDSRLSQVGIVTGELKVFMRDSSDAASLATDYGLTITSSMKNIKLYFMVSQASSYNLSSLLKSIKNDSRVSNAELTIVSRNYEKL